MDASMYPLDSDDAFSIIHKLRLELEKVSGHHQHHAAEDHSMLGEHPHIVPFFIPSTIPSKNMDVCPHCEQQWGKDRTFLQHRISSLKEKLSISQDEAAHAKKDHTTVLARLKVKTSQLKKMEEMCTQFHYSFHLQALEVSSLCSQLESLRQASELVETQRTAEGEQLGSIYKIRDEIEEECVSLRTDLTKRTEKVEDLHTLLVQARTENTILGERTIDLENDCLQMATTSGKLRECLDKKVQELMIATSQLEKIESDIIVMKQDATDKDAEILKLQELLLYVSTASSEHDVGGCVLSSIHMPILRSQQQDTSLSDVPCPSPQLLGMEESGEKKIKESEKDSVSHAESDPDT
jgi:chromosome segregation ATPase